MAPPPTPILTSCTCSLYGEQKSCEMLEEAEKADKAAEAAQSAEKGGRPGKKRKTVSKTGTVYYDFGGDSVYFMQEVEMMKARYSALSAWLVHLLAEKRNGGTKPKTPRPPTSPNAQNGGSNSTADMALPPQP